MTKRGAVIRKITRCSIILWFVIILQTICFSTVFGENILPVPHLLEYGEDIGVISGAQTCGPCSLEMCAAYMQYRKADFENVKKINAFLEPEKADDEYYLSHGRPTGWDELITAAEHIYQIKKLEAVDYSAEKIKEEIDKQSPVIFTLANYGALSNREDKGYDGGHIMVINGYNDNGVICQDPDCQKQNINYSWQEINDSIGGYKMIVGFKRRPKEEFEEPLCKLKRAFLKGRIGGFVTSHFIYKVWVVEQIGNHILIVEEKTVLPLFGGDSKRVVDIQNCFLRDRENTPIGKNCLALEMEDCLDVLVEQPAVKLTESTIYLDLHKKYFLYEAITEQDQKTLKINLSVESEKDYLPEEITGNILLKAMRKWFFN
ncbi:MAG: C39 family peptidase [Patescibacteria group bacterium]|nr:C39 family peptidase [Patescibacteria group bacterium]